MSGATSYVDTGLEGGRTVLARARRGWQLMSASHVALVSALALLVIALAALLAPAIAPYSPIAISPDTLAPPGLHHLFGTDEFGRDMLSRVVWGARLTLLAALVSGAIGWAVLTATPLNFLGFGVPLPTPEWGADLAAGRDWLGVAWWISTFPGLAMAATILAANYLGDHVAAVLEPRGRLAL